MAPAAKDAARRVAQRVADDLATRPDVLAIAATGSVARGDFGEGSDIDLWVLAAHDGQEDMTIEGFDVSFLFCTMAQADCLEGRLRFETQTALVLHDPDDHFLYLKERDAALSEETAQVALDLYANDLLAFARAAYPLPATERLAMQREVVRRAAILRMFIEGFGSSIKFRHFEDHLLPEDYAFLLELSAFPESQSELLDDLRHALSLRLPEAVPEIPLPTWSNAKRWYQNGRGHDLVVAIRRALPPTPERSRRPTHEAHLQLFRRVHVINPAPAVVHQHGRDALEFCDSLELLDLMGPEFQASLVALAEGCRPG